MSEPEILTDRQAFDLIEQQTIQFINQHLRQSHTAAQWQREFERWLAGNSLQGAWEEDKLWRASLERIGG